MSKPNNIILEGVVGSIAYGLATENSDIDVKGIYLLPRKEALRLRFNPENTTVVHTHPDWVYHEVGKFMRLAANGNPTITELLYLEEYTKLTPIGQLLIDYREAFLSTVKISKAYRGYAFDQAKKLSNRQKEGLVGYDSALKNRFSKHTRHCFRLLLQAKQLLETGTLHVRVTKEEREWLFKMGEQTPETVVDAFMVEDRKFENVKSVLPDEPNWEMLDELIYSIRMM